MSATLTGAPGELAVSVDIYAGHGALLALHVTYGDGSYDPPVPTVDCTAVSEPFEYHVAYTHRYALADSYDLQATTSVSSDCPAPPEEVDHWAHTELRVDVPTGYGRNGPAAPTFQVNSALPSVSPLVLEIFPVVWDDDGWVHHFTLDWGDGSPVQTFLNTSACTYYQGSFAQGLPAAPGGQQHDYGKPGIYTITITAVSTDCEGNSPQTATTTIPFNPN